jgi:hypothetical protein
MLWRDDWQTSIKSTRNVLLCDLWASVGSPSSHHEMR